MQMFRQTHGFRSKVFRLRENDIYVIEKSLKKDVEYAVDYLDLGVRVIKKGNPRVRLLEAGAWIGLVVQAFFLINTWLNDASASSLHWWALGSTIFLAAALYMTATRDHRLIYLTGGEETLSILADVPDEEATAEFVREVVARIREAYCKRYVEGETDLSRDDRKAQLKWLHDIKILDWEEHQLLLAKFEQEGYGRQIGFLTA